MPHHFGYAEHLDQTYGPMCGLDRVSSSLPRIDPNLVGQDAGLD